MAAPSTKTVLITLLLVGVAVSSGVVFLDDVLADSWSENGVVVRPTDDPNGEYATVGSDGTVTVALDEPGINPQSLTIVRRVFMASNRGENWTRVWLTHDDSTRLSVVDERTGDPILGADNSTVLAPGDRLVATLRIDTRSTNSVPADVLLNELVVHTEPVDPPDPKRTPTTVTITTTADAPSSDAESFAVDFGPGIGHVNVSVDTLSVAELDQRDPETAAGPSPVIRSASSQLRAGELAEDGRNVAASTSGGIRVNGTSVDLVVPARTVVSLDGTRSLIPTASHVDSQLRIAAAVDVTVPRSLRDHSAVLRFSVPRSRFSETSPEDARIGHRTPGGWELLQTRVVDRTESRVVLEARTPGFSRFVVFAAPDVSYRWDLPGDRTIAGARAETVFQDPGLHPVSLVVSTDRGASAATDAVVLANDRPLIRVDRPVNVSAGMPVTLRAAITNEYGDTNVSWVLPDGSTMSGRSVRYTFEPGTHTVTVHASDSFGAHATTTETVHVSPSGATNPRSMPSPMPAPIRDFPGLDRLGSGWLLDLVLVVAALTGGLFLLGIVGILVLFGSGRLRVGDREDDVLVAAFRGHATLGSGLDDDEYDAERAIEGLFETGESKSLADLLPRIDGGSFTEVFDQGIDRPIDAIFDRPDEVPADTIPFGLLTGPPDATVTRRLVTAVLRAPLLIAVIAARLVHGARASSSRSAGPAAQSTHSFSLPTLRRTRGPEVTAFYDPTWDPEHNRFVIGTLAVIHPDRDLATVEITIVDDDGDPLARKTVDLHGRGEYRASPELVPGVPEAEVADTSEYAVQVRVIDRRSNEATVRRRVHVPRGVSAT